MIKELPKEIYVKVDGKEGMVDTDKYIIAKTGDLQEFGYADLTEETVKEQLLKILNKEKLSVIGVFMEGDIDVTKTA